MTALLNWLKWQLIETPEQRRLREMKNVHLFVAGDNRERQRGDEVCFSDECVARVRANDGPLEE